MSEATEISTERWLSGARMTTSMGRIAPKEKVIAATFLVEVKCLTLWPLPYLGSGA